MIDGGAQDIVRLAIAEVGTNEYVDVHGTDSLSLGYLARFEQCKDEILSRFDWIFAKVCAPLSYDTAFEGYLKPLDCMRICFLLNGGECCGCVVTCYKECVNLNDGLMYIKCTCATHIHYISNQISVLNWSPLARQCLISTIASHLASGSGRPQQSFQLLQKAEMYYKRATLVNSNDKNRNFKHGYNIV